VLNILKLVLKGGFLSAAVKQRLRAARRTAGVVAVLFCLALTTTIVGAACVGAAAYLALRPIMPDYQAALAVGGGFFLLAGLVVLVAATQLRRAVAGPARAPAAATVPSPTSATDPRGSNGPEDPLVRLISESVQSPVIVSALVLGIAAGRMTKRSPRD